MRSSKCNLLQGNDANDWTLSYNLYEVTIETVILFKRETMLDLLLKRKINKRLNE